MLLAMRNHPADVEVANDGCGVLCYCVLEAEDVVRESALACRSRAFLKPQRLPRGSALSRFSCTADA